MSTAPCGLLPVCKPPGPTSAQVVAAVRRLFGRDVRVGHAGTLDPAAAGVLPICVGAATRLAEYLHLPAKEYRFELVLGLETDTQDATGRILAEHDACGLDGAQVAAALAALVGTITQRPPLHSARHHQGRRLYEYAREGQAVEPASATVRIDALRLLSFAPGHPARALCALVCGSGTYVRAVCADVGAALGTGGHMGVLVRHRAGGLCGSECRTLEELEAEAQHGGLHGLLRTPAEALGFLPALALPWPEAEAVLHGRPPGRRRATPGEPDGALRLLHADGRLIAVATRRVQDGVTGFVLERVMPADAS